MSNLKVINIVPDDLKKVCKDVSSIFQFFVKECEPIEKGNIFYIMTDACTNARYCECHIKANKLLSHGTVDVPLDPEDQPDYRANREMVEDHAAYERMRAASCFTVGLSTDISRFQLDFTYATSCFGSNFKHEKRTKYNQFHEISIPWLEGKSLRFEFK